MITRVLMTFKQMVIAEALRTFRTFESVTLTMNSVHVPFDRKFLPELLQAYLAAILDLLMNGIVVKP